MRRRDRRTGSRTLRIVLVAPHASLVYGGEATLPLSYFRGLRARGIDVWMLVHERTRAELLDLLGPDQNRVLFVPDTWLNVALFRLSQHVPRRVGETTFGELLLYLTQRAQRRKLRALLTPGTVVYQPIPVSPRSPSAFYRLGAPVIIGPVNGGMDYPPAFREKESWVVRSLIHMGRAISPVVNHLLPGKRDAAFLLVANLRSRDALPIQPRGQLVVVAENGVDLATWTLRDTAHACPDRFLYMGRLVDWKALEIVLHAMQSVPGATLQVAGDGAMSAPWMQLTQALGLAHRVEFLGWQSPEQCAALLQTCTALVLPSLLEAGGAVVLQAMSAGVPVIATNWGGPSDYLDEQCGILVEPASRDALVQGFADGMNLLMHSPQLCRSLGEKGRLKIEEQYDWERKIDFMLHLFQQAMNEYGLKRRAPHA